MKGLALCACALFAVCAVRAATPFEHALYESVPLDGAWEMAYLPREYATNACPKFAGVTVPDAIPGYWEDMTDRFRAAGMKDAFRINPWYGRQTLPTGGRADDTTLPDIYGCFLYRRTVRLDRTDPAVLRFEGVRNQVHVWINGRFAGFRAGFSTPFELAVPPGTLKAGENEIVLAVSNNPNVGCYGALVSGLTTRALFRSTGGVNGRLELRFPKGGLGDVYVTTARDLGTFTVHVAGRDRYDYEIAEDDRILRKGTAVGDVTLPMDGLEFWSPGHPKRYALRLRTPRGACERRFGLRRLAADGERLRLNGEPVYLRGVTEHCYFARTIHVPRDLAYYRMITAKRKELGFNFVRFHTFVPPAEYLEATDELGMLVHIESPNFVTEDEYAAIVAFARRHPSVVIYCTGNETRIDRLAEAYLERIAKLVHDGTDALFSPMSAMRGVEYCLVSGKDTVVPDPFEHNPDRMRRLARFCDVWTSYQLGLTSYDSLNSASARTLDAWGDAYCGKPRTSHEICIDGSYADLSLERDYPPGSPIVRAGILAGIRRQLERKGLVGRADAYFRNSCEWMRRIRKFTFEKVRASDRTAGFDFLGDINTHWHTFGYSVGMMDEFYRLKPGETAENVLRYNSAAVLLSDLGSDFNVTAGTVKKVAFSVSNYDADAPGAKLTVRLSGGDVTREFSLGDIPNGCVSKLVACELPIPQSAVPRKYLLQGTFAGGRTVARNEWEIYAWPKVAARPVPSNLRVAGNMSGDELLAAMAKGERVLLLGAGPFNSLPTTYRIGMAGRCSGNFATVIKPGHPIFRDFPEEGYCGWQFRRLMEGGRAVQLEAGVPFDPIVDVASSVKFVIRQAALFEYRVGEGRLLVCSFDFRSDDPAAAWLKARLADYASSDAFRPSQRLTPDQLKSVLAAPLLDGSVDANRARNPQDPASEVRAGDLAQP